MSEVFIVNVQRTPVGKGVRGYFKDVPPSDLLVHVLKHSLAQAPNLDPKLIDDVIIGCAMPEGAQGMNVARVAILEAGLPDCVPGMTINRFCCSGLQTMALAAQRIALGEADVIIAGGVESMSAVPLGGYNLQANPSWFNDENIAIAYGMGITAEIVGEKWGITREMQDEFAFNSHQRALKAIQAGDTEGLVPFEVKSDVPFLTTGEIKTKTFTAENDEGARADTSLEKLAKLRPAFSARGTVTPGNSSQVSDGSSVAMLVSEKMLKELKLDPIARLCSYEVVGVEPELMGIGPAKAIPKALKCAGVSLNDMKRIELNEAFAAQSLAVIKEMDLNSEIVNPKGGAIALGHPLGATGAILSTKLISGLNKGDYGMVTMCIGTGMGAAGVFERL